MILKFFYVYSFKKICTIFPSLQTQFASSSVRRGWVSSMQQYTGKAYLIEHDYGDAYKLQCIDYLWDKRLGQTLEVQDDVYKSGYPFLIRDKANTHTYIIKTIPESGCVGQIINVQMRSVVNKEQQLHNVFQYCKR